MACPGITSLEQQALIWACSVLSASFVVTLLVQKKQGVNPKGIKRTSMSQILKLFSKPDCELCDIAEQLVNHVLDNEVQAHPDRVWRLEKVNIEQLGGRVQEQYAWTIPVLMNAQSGEELFWPFPPSRIKTLISE